MGTALTNFADRLAYQVLRVLPPEAAHDLGKWAMARRQLAPGPITLPAESAPRLFGQTLPNPLGLAAGFDKNAQIVDAAIDYGFGFVEVGSVTFRGGPGNPKPRMFRLDDQTIMNRMGLNGDPAEVVAARLAKIRTPFFGVNIAKTHSPDILGDAAIEDICSSYRLLHRFGMYTAINVSCPNTREGRTFEDPCPLAELLAGLRSGSLTTPVLRYAEEPDGASKNPALRRTSEPASSGNTGALDSLPDGAAPPLMVKLSPVLDPGEEGGAARLESVLNVCEGAKVDGYICCNTLPADNPRFGRGGISGNVIRPRALRMVEFITARLNRPVIGCGGIYTRDHLDSYLQRGCAAVQAYNGFVRGPTAGVRFAHRILDVRN